MPICPHTWWNQQSQKQLIGWCRIIKNARAKGNAKGKGRPRAKADAALAPAAACINVRPAKAITFPKQLVTLKAYGPRDPSSAVSESAPVHAGQTNMSCLKKTIEKIWVIDNQLEEEASSQLETGMFKETPRQQQQAKCQYKGSPEGGQWTRVAYST
jgi:hypothetical protein